MRVIRPLAWPGDREGVLALDASFTTDRVYRVVGTASAFALEEVRLAAPRRKAYDMAEVSASLAELQQVLVAEVGGEVAGLAALRLESWNRRGIVEHLHVAPAHRGRGLGRALLEGVEREAAALGARCLWVETQDVNLPAVAFYRAVGFRWCGLDRSLYDGDASGEVALFFVRELPLHPPPPGA